MMRSTGRKRRRVRMISTRLRATLLTISLGLSGCAALPPAPEINQCAYSIKFNKFRCCDTVSKKCFNLRRDDPEMEAAQCVSAEDFKKGEAWIQTVIDIANQRCK